MSRRFALFFCVLVAWLVSCAETRQPTLEVTATASTLAPGQTARLTVMRYFAGGPSENVTTRVHFTVTPRDVLKVEPDGTVSPGSESGNAAVRVTDPDTDASTTLSFVVLGSKIVSLRIDPSAPAVALAPGQSRRFGAIATLGDGSEQDVTTRVQWSSSYEAAATVGKTQPDTGVVTAISEGDTTITITDVLTNTQAYLLVFVRGAGPNLVAINVTPNPSTVLASAPTPLSATAVYANGKSADITKTTAWSSSDSTIATVDANGVAIGVAVGAVTITATSVDGSVKGSAALKVQ